MADPKMEIIDECAKGLCRFFKRDPDESIPIPYAAGGSILKHHPLWRLVRGRVFECVMEVSKVVEPPSNGGGNGN